MPEKVFQTLMETLHMDGFPNKSFDSDLKNLSRINEQNYGGISEEFHARFFKTFFFEKFWRNI